MSAKIQRCIATTDTGARCSNDAIVGSAFCGVHDGQQVRWPHRANGTSTTSRSAKNPMTPEMQLLMQEVDALVRELRARRPHVGLSDMTPAQFVHVVNQAIGRRLPASAATLLEDVERNLAGTSLADFADPDVVRGMALVAYYSLQAQSEPIRGRLAERLQQVPGYSLFDELRQNLNNVTISDFAQPATWSVVYDTASTEARSKLIQLLSEYAEQHDATAPPPS